MTDTTLVRIPVRTRDRIKDLAGERDQTFGELIDDGLDLIERERFWTRIGSVVPDRAYLEEFDEWDSSDFDTDNPLETP
jgi:hypothetical protein